MQIILSFALVLIIFVVCFLTKDYIGYRVVALVLLMTVSFIAMLFDILPVLLISVLSAVIWNFFFIPPLFTFHINNMEDILMFFLYFIIALVNAVLTFKIRKEEKRARNKEEKENTIKLYDTLLNSLSHELRTPVSTIIGAVDTIKENEIKLNLEKRKELLNEIEKAALRLNRQVDNLLNMSRLESGMIKLKPDWCDINELINNVIQKTISLKKQKIIFISDEKLPLFRIDEGLIEQVLYNLIINAIQYTADNSVIEISVNYKLEECFIIIEDNGKGFPEKEINYVFNKFYRLQNTKTGGSGLGLSIVKGFVEAHNGTVTLENKKIGGSKFTIQIPVKTTFINNLKNE